MRNPKIKDFILTFETAGSASIYEELFCDVYMPADSLSIYENGTVRAFISKKAIEKMQKFGERSSPEKTKLFIKDLDVMVEKTKTELRDIDKKDFKIKDLIHMYGLIKNISKKYKYFDFNYWDKVYEKSKDNKVALEKIELISGFKNKIRAELGPVFFGKDGYMDILLKKISMHSHVNQDDLRWYLEKEIIDLFKNGKKLSEETIISRKNSFVTFKDSKGKCYFFNGKKAGNFIEKFGKDEVNMKEEIIKGMTAHATGKIIKAKVCVIAMDYWDKTSLVKSISKMEKGDVLVSQTTSPELMDALRKASAIITDVGGLLSHAAITARELNIPCIVGTKISTQLLKDGDMVEVDADKGIVKIVK